MFFLFSLENKSQFLSAHYDTVSPTQRGIEFLEIKSSILLRIPASPFDTQYSTIARHFQQFWSFSVSFSASSSCSFSSGLLSLMRVEGSPVPGVVGADFDIQPARFFMQRDDFIMKTPAAVVGLFSIFEPHWSPLGDAKTLLLAIGE